MFRKQKNTSTRVSLFFVHFFAVAVRLRPETPYFHVLRRTRTQDNDPLFLFLNFHKVIYNPTPKKYANI